MNEKFFIEAKVSAKDKDLESIIKKAGIVYPHPSLGFFKAIYAPFETSNKNGVRLAASVEDDLPKLKGTQVNFNHYRQGNICGAILDAWRNDNEEIEIAFKFDKSVYPNEYEEALELFEKGELTVSFELRVDKDQIEVMADGTRRLHRVDFDGVGLLMGEAPAYPGAIVFEKAKALVRRIIGQDSRDLVFAQYMADDCKSILQEIEVAIKEKENIFKLGQEEEQAVDKLNNDKLLATQKETIIAEFGEELVKDWTDEDYMNQDKIDALRTSLAEKASETVENETEESSVENKSDFEETEKAEVSNEETIESEETAQVKVEEETKKKVTEVIDDEKGTDTVTIETEAVRKVDDKVVETTKRQEEIVWTFAQVEALKAEYEEKLTKKDEEIAKIKENAPVVAKLRAELGDFAKDLSDEDLLNSDKVENAQLKQENATLKAEPKVESTFEAASVDETLETGHDKIVKEEVKQDNVKEFLSHKYEQMKKK